MTIKLTINGTAREVDVEPETPLLWVLRDNLGLAGTKFGCGIAECGVCTVQLDGRPVKSCTTTAASAVGREITTIEGLSRDNSHPVQRAWIEHGVPQCGYCHSGQIMAAAALLSRTAKPTDSEIDAAMAGNLCRCGTYLRVRKAIHRAAELMQGSGRTST
jgi:aerobic-type carbon monoxide dehydrogenase small subunit (CoxS/CutS family)